ncbi:MAG: hypothetical protein ACRDL7_14715 [Gaiellaceae bacterium]
MTAGMAAANVAVSGVKAYRTAMGAMASRTADKAALQEPRSSWRSCRRTRWHDLGWSVPPLKRVRRF